MRHRTEELEMNVNIARTLVERPGRVGEISLPESFPNGKFDQY